jgi:hypothetical protein
MQQAYHAAAVCARMRMPFRNWNNRGGRVLFVGG